MGMTEGAGAHGTGAGSVRRVDATTLRWAVGAYCAAMGALMLVAPHQFGAATYQDLAPHLPWWGSGFLATGSALLVVATFDAGRPLAMATHFAAGALLLLLAWGSATEGATGAGVAYAVLGAGTVIAPFVPAAYRSARAGPADGLDGAGGAPDAPIDLLFLVLGGSAVALGTIQIFAPQQYAAPMFDHLRPWLAWQGAAFLAGGVALLASQAAPTLPGPAHGAAHLAAGGAFVTYLIAVSVPDRNLTGLVYYGGFGAAIMLLPWLAPRLRTADPRSLGVGVSLAQAGVAAVPLIATVALLADQVERRVAEQALRTQQVLAVALAEDLAGDVNLHRALLAGLAAYPGLRNLPAAEQQELLDGFRSAYPSIFDLRVDRVGADVGPPYDAPLPQWHEAPRTHAAVVGVVIALPDARPVVVFSQPLFDAQGRPAGAVTGAVETATLASDLNDASAEGREIYLVDADGRVVAHADPSPVAAFADLSGRPPVAALLRDAAGRRTGGALRYAARNGERLAGYAPLPDLGWGVVVERPASLALASVHSGRDLAAGVLFAAVALAAGLGVLAATYLAAPLDALRRAVDALAAGGKAAPLPGGGPTEVRRLAQRFGEMRTRLTANAAERERLLERERGARAAAEAMARQRDRVLRDVRCKLWRATVTERDGDLQWDAVYINEEAVRKYFPVPEPAEAGSRTYVAAWLERRVPEDVERLHAFVRQKVLAGEDYTVEFRWRRADGEIRWLREHVEVRPLRQGQWEAVGLTVDITEERLLEQERLQRALAAAEAEQAARLRAEEERLKDEFFANISHDLRTPLTAIKASVGVVLANEPPGMPQPLHRLLTAVDRATDRMTALVTDLLDLTRLQAARVQLDRDLCDLAALARQVAQTAEGLLLARDQRLVVDVPVHAVWAEVDRGRIERVLLNLLSNAAKYGRQGGVVLLRLDEAGGEVGFAVADDGPGIAKADQARLFERFYRGPTQGQAIAGTGLGLAIARALVELHGGRIWVESEPGEGATFRFILPATGTADHDAPAGGRSEAPAPGTLSAPEVAPATEMAPAGHA